VITGAHAIVFAEEPDAARAFFGDTLGLRAVDAGGGWLIFALPPAELGIHPAEDGEDHHELYLMCDDVERTMKELKAKGVEFTGAPRDQGFGIVTAIKLPGGGELGLYQPKHPVALGKWE
jgi:catechol 2,3-dioxygenase-like lactoylglutathione lyase family enzyme